jgi:hypothetical protein
MPKAFQPTAPSFVQPPSWGQEPSTILRVAQSQYTKSPYALEDNPWVSREEWETLLLLRGVIVSSYGQIETTLAELSLRLSLDSRCAELRASFPNAIDKRIKFLRECLNLPPYNRRFGLADQIFRRFEKASFLRHIMAHGRITHPAMGWYTFQNFKTDGPSEVLSRQHRFTIYDLELHAYAAARLARRSQRLFAQANTQGWIPSL